MSCSHKGQSRAGRGRVPCTTSPIVIDSAGREGLYHPPRLPWAWTSSWQVGKRGWGRYIRVVTILAQKQYTCLQLTLPLGEANRAMLPCGAAALPHSPHPERKHSELSLPHEASGLLSKKCGQRGTRLTTRAEKDPLSSRNPITSSPHVFQVSKEVQRVK